MNTPFGLFVVLLVGAFFLVGAGYVVAERRSEVRRRREQRAIDRANAVERRIVQRHFRIIGPDDRPAA